MEKKQNTGKLNDTKNKGQIESGRDMQEKYMESKLKSSHWRCDGIARKNRAKPRKKTSLNISIFSFI